MVDRSKLINSFLKGSPWALSQRQTIAGDASNRRYERLTLQDGTTAILMDAPTNQGEDTRPFIEITNFLRNAKLSAPKILAQDPINGFLLLEDLGDDLFARIVSTNPIMERLLYEAATDVLLHLHEYNPPQLSKCDAKMMTNMVSVAFTWYQFGVVGYTDRAAQTTFQSAFYSALKPLNKRTNVIIQRDYHSENLIWIPNRSGISRVGLLDYQDALIGHRAYDLVSILQDARRDISLDVTQDMVTRYISSSGIQYSEFMVDYALLGLQRNLRILGIFTRLSLAYGKPQYVDFIPRVWSHIQKNLTHPVLKDIAPMIHKTLPEPTSIILQELKEKCATIPLQ